MTAAVIARLLDFVERTSFLVGVLDADGRLTYLNESARKRLGYADITGLTATDFFDGDVLERYYGEIRSQLLRTGIWAGDAAILTQEGEPVPLRFELVADVAPGGEIKGLVVVGRPRDDEAADDAPTDRRVGVVHVTVRGLRDIVSAHGEFVADGVMRALDRRLTLAVRASDVVTSTADDTFVVVLEGVRDVAEVLRHAQALHDVCVREPVSTAIGPLAIDLDVHSSFGEAADPSERLPARPERAPSAPTSAAAPVGDDAVVREAAEEVDIERAGEALRLAVLHGDIRTYVNPIVDRHGHLVGYEAFPRWSHASYGTYEGAPLYDIAEHVRGVRATIDLRVLREAAAVATTSPGTVPPRVHASIGASLLDDVYVEQYVWEIADAMGLSADRVHLMIDPAIVTDLHPKRHDTLRSLRDNGCALVLTAIDDASDVEALVGAFGATDIRLVDDALARAVDDADAARLVEWVVAAAHRAGAQVIAPGISTTAVRSAAFDLGIDFTTGAVYGNGIAADSIV